MNGANLNRQHRSNRAVQLLHFSPCPSTASTVRTGIFLEAPAQRCHKRLKNKYSCTVQTQAILAQRRRNETQNKIESDSSPLPHRSGRAFAARAVITQQRQDHSPTPTPHTRWPYTQPAQTLHCPTTAHRPGPGSYTCTPRSAQAVNSGLTDA